MALTYLVIVFAVFAATAATTRPDKVGLDWIPFILLSMPWYALNNNLVVPGLIANTGLMYLLGTILEGFWRRIAKH